MFICNYNIHICDVVEIYVCSPLLLFCHHGVYLCFTQKWAENFKQVSFYVAIMLICDSVPKLVISENMHYAYTNHIPRDFLFILNQIKLSLSAH